MLLTKREEICLNLAEDVITFFRQHQGEGYVEFRLDVMSEPHIIDAFNLNPQHRRDIINAIAVCIVNMMRQVPVDEIIEEAAAYRLVLGGHLLTIVQTLPLRELENGQA